MNKEQAWKRERLGRITASELHNIFSASGKIIDTNIDYIRHKRFERKKGFSYPTYAKNFDIGHEQEPYAVAWFRANYPDMPIVYSQDVASGIPVWVADFANFSASPDAFSPDEKFVLEVKTVVSNTGAEFYADELTPYEVKKESVIKEHMHQIAGLFLSNPKVEEVWLLKYIYQRDDCDADTSSPLEPWRGHLFSFSREDLDLENIKQRIIQFDNFIDSDIPTTEIKNGFNK